MTYFSIIIPLYNKENFIENTIQSVLKQTFQDFEIIIVDDGSQDKSAEKVKQLNDKRIQYYFKENEGVSSARNFGIVKAKANYITFIDADDYWYPNFLETMCQNIIQFPEQKVFAAAIEIETSKKTFPAQYSIQKTDENELVNYFSASSKQSVLCTSCAAFHKSVFEEIGAFDINIKSGQDTDLWIRIGLVYPILFSCKILARYVYAPESLSKNIKYSTRKLNFSKFKELEKTNPDLKKFLDLNRFSLAIKSKLINDNVNFDLYYKSINMVNLNLKKRILLHLPPFLLNGLIKIKIKLANIGLENSVFK